MRALLATLAALLALLGGVAHAQDTPVVALLPLDGPPGASSRDMQVWVRGLTAAMDRDGRVEVISGDGLIGSLSAQRQEQLQEARDAFTEGQLMLAEGDPDIGLAFLAESLAAHERAGSAVVRREEMADTAFILAKALLAVGREDQARKALTRALRLLPDYLDTQSEASDPALRSLARTVEQDLLARPPQRLSEAGAVALSEDLQVDRIVHGALDGAGGITLTVYDRDERLWTGTRPFEALRVGDPGYEPAARAVIAASLGLPVPEPEPEPEPIAPPGPEDPVPAPPDPPSRAGVAVALGVTAGVLAAGAATTAVLLTQRPDPARDGWELQVRLVR